MADERIWIDEGGAESWERRPDRKIRLEWDRERDRDDLNGQDRDRGKTRVPLANTPPNPPLVPVDPKITDTLNDPIARTEIVEANEADAKNVAGGEGGRTRREPGVL
ncbi:hypothetical protein FRC10_002133, partial [Ceratobasidium sp. 414]